MSFEDKVNSRLLTETDKIFPATTGKYDYSLNDRSICPFEASIIAAIQLLPSLPTATIF